MYWVKFKIDQYVNKIIYPNMTSIIFLKDTYWPRKIYSHLDQQTNG